jgi:hypothetical protein
LGMQGRALSAYHYRTAKLASKLLIRPDVRISNHHAKKENTRQDQCKS